MEDSLLAALIIILLALTTDGIEMIYRTVKSSHNKKIIDQFRAELRNFPAKKASFGFAIPCYKNPADLAACLDNLINWVGISPADIVVVDDYSNDNDKTINEARKFGVTIAKLTKYEKDVRKIRAQKKAAEILYKQGKEYVVALDSDSFIKVKKYYFDYCIEEMELLGLDILAGRIMPLLNEKSNLLERAQVADYLIAMRAVRGSMYRICSNNFEVKNIEDLKKKYTLARADILCVSGAFGIFKTKLLLEILNECKILCGGEDSEITLRALAKGAKIGYDDDIVIETIVPHNLRAFTRQRDFWARFVSSHYINAPYFKQIFKRNGISGGIGIETAETSLAIATLKDILIHPIKLASLVFLWFQPICLIFFLLSYEILHLANINLLKNNGDKHDWLADLLSPFIDMYRLFLPTTIGYIKYFFLGIRRSWREKNELIIKLEKDFYLSIGDFNFGQVKIGRSHIKHQNIAA